jgi:hypothetical protein
MEIELHPKFLSSPNKGVTNRSVSQLLPNVAKSGVSAVGRAEHMLIPPQPSVFKVKFDHVRVQRVHAEVAIYI